jgi:hypothetical protein
MAVHPKENQDEAPPIDDIPPPEETQETEQEAEANEEGGTVSEEDENEEGNENEEGKEDEGGKKAGRPAGSKNKEAPESMKITETELEQARAKLGYFYYGEWQEMFENLSIPKDIKAKVVIADAPFNEKSHYSQYSVKSMLKRLEPYVSDSACLFLPGWYYYYYYYYYYY